MDAIQSFLRRDWAIVLVAGIIAILALSFVGAPRAISEMVAGTADTFTGGRFGENRMARLLLGVVVGLLARSWREALIGIGVAIGAVFAIGVDLPSDDVARGLVMIGIMMAIGIVAALTRILLHDHALSRRATVVAAVAVAIIGIVGAIGLPKASYSDVATDNIIVTDLNVTEGLDQPDLLANVFGPSAPPPPIDLHLDNASTIPTNTATPAPSYSSQDVDRLYDAVRATGMPMYAGETNIVDAASDSPQVANAD